MLACGLHEFLGITDPRLNHLRRIQRLHDELASWSSIEGIVEKRSDVLELQGGQVLVGHGVKEAELHAAGARAEHREPFLFWVFDVDALTDVSIRRHGGDQARDVELDVPRLAAYVGVEVLFIVEKKS